MPDPRVRPEGRRSHEERDQAVQIVLTATGGVQRPLPRPWAGGAEASIVVFSDNLTWVSIDGIAVAGSAGTHSGRHTLLRIAWAGDGVLAEGIGVLEYAATFVLNAVRYGGRHLEAGQVTARGVWYTDTSFSPG
jgi:hypothetical protein